MTESLKRSIKEVIAEYPEVGRILTQYGIGCVTCAVGTCPLEDIINIHKLPGHEGAELMEKIMGIMAPGLKATPSTTTRKTLNNDEMLHRLSPPIQQLVDEHTTIKRFLARIPSLAERIRFSDALDRETILKAVSFIRECADRFHHAKEEDILFAYGDPSHPVFQAMRKDHCTARGLVMTMLQSLEDSDREGISNALLSYRELLKDHIKKEDGILYPWIDGELSTQEVGELYARFRAVEQDFGGDPFQRYRDFIDGLN